MVGSVMVLVAADDDAEFLSILTLTESGDLDLSSAIPIQVVNDLHGRSVHLPTDLGDDIFVCRLREIHRVKRQLDRVALRLRFKDQVSDQDPIVSVDAISGHFAPPTITAPVLWA